MIKTFQEWLSEGKKYKSILPSWDIVDNLEWGISQAKKLGGNIAVWFDEVPSMVGGYGEDTLFMTADTDDKAKDIIPVKASDWVAKAEAIVNSNDYVEWKKEKNHKNKEMK